MSERLYYTNAYQTEFEARITGVTTVNQQPAVVLDQSYFYPTSGGQPYDTGMLNSQLVVEVVIGEAGEVLHILQEPLPDAQRGQMVHGSIDWERRYDHMQQHSGQHLLSQIFYQRFGLETVSVHFGATESTLDLESPELTPEQLDEAEAAAMQLVYAALPINVYFIDEQELHTIPLRRPPKVSGTVRIVEIDRFDYSACGGTHCRTTAEIGPIKLTRVERRRGQVRVTFLCGRRAWVDYQAKHQLITTAANLFSNEISLVPSLIERNMSQIKELQHQLALLQTALLRVEAEQLLATAFDYQGYRLLQLVFTDKDVNTVKQLASQLQQQERVICLFSAVQAEKTTLIFARAADVNLHMGNLLRDVLREIGGKGGGREDFAQGGGITVQQGETLLALSSDWLKQRLLPPG